MSPKTVACGNCGSLNAADFERCIRCGKPLSQAAPAERATRRVPAPRRRGALGPGAETLFGKYPPEMLPAAKTLVMLNLLVFTAHLMGALTRGSSVMSAILSGGGSFEGLLYGAIPRHLPGFVIMEEPWRLLSACFVHFGAIHAGMNMMGLIVLSRAAEPLVGSVRLVIAYVVSGIVGFAASLGWAVMSAQGGMSAGASGAVFGLLGLLLGVFLRHGDRARTRRVLEMVIFALVFGFIVQFVDNAAHIGGLVAGLLFGLAFAPGAPKPSHGWQRLLAVLLMLASVGAIAAARFSPAYDFGIEQIQRDRLEERAP